MKKVYVISGFMKADCGYSYPIIHHKYSVWSKLEDAQDGLMKILEDIEKQVEIDGETCDSKVKISEEGGEIKVTYSTGSVETWVIEQTYLDNK